jgi:hypothetical protein
MHSKGNPLKAFNFRRNEPLPKSPTYHDLEIKETRDALIESEQKRHDA